MRPDRIVMAPPAFDDDLSFSEGVEDLAIEQLIAKAGVEALDVAVLPRTAPLDIGSLGADSGDPSLDSLGDELRSVVGPDVTGNAAQDEQVGQNVDDIDCFELAGDTGRQAFVGKLVNDIEHPISASIVGAVLVAVAAVLLGKLDNIGRQTLLVLTAARDLALRRAMLSERRAGATLGDMQLRSHLLNAGTATRGA